MYIKFKATLPEKLKRGYISALDRRAVYQVAGGTHFKIKHCMATFKRANQANYYHQSNIFSRIMARVKPDLDAIACGTYLNIHNCLVSTNDHYKSQHCIRWQELGKLHNIAKFGRLAQKCYTYIKAVDDCFELLPMLKSYCIEILKLSEAEIMPFLTNGYKFRTTSTEVFDLKRLLTTEEFKKLTHDQQTAWYNYLVNYTDGLKQREKLIAIRDHATDLVKENGGAYNFLVKACKELLL